MGELTTLPNIGKTLESQLATIGIQTIAQLKATGSKEAWGRIKQMDTSAWYNRLCALEGAIRGIRKQDLPEDVKADLKAFTKEFRQKQKEQVKK